MKLKISQQVAYGYVISASPGFGRVKIPMGLEPFEVIFFFRVKITKVDLALKGVIRNRSKIGIK